VSNLFTEVTKVLGSKHHELWIDASRFEWTRFGEEKSKGMESARQFVQLGLRRHSDCLDLFIQVGIELCLLNSFLNHKLHGEMILIIYECYRGLY
jgi:hypothetical protein